MKMLAASLAILTLSACDYSHSIDTDHMSNVTLREKFGKTRALRAADADYQELVDYLESNRHGWRRHPETVPPIEIVFSSDQFVLYIGDDSVYLLERGESLLVRSLQRSTSTTTNQ